MPNPMEAIDFKGVINVIAGQYLCYLAYKIHKLPDVPANRVIFLLICTILFVICGIALCVFGFRQIIIGYRDYQNTKNEDASPDSPEE